MVEQQPLITSIDESMVKGLNAFYELVSSEWKGPRGECSWVSEQIARQFGLLYVEGKFRVDAPLVFGSSSIEEDHAWCVDGTRRIVDLTADQFNPGLYNKLPRGLLIVDWGDPLYPRYRPTRAIR